MKVQTTKPDSAKAKSSGFFFSKGSEEETRISPFFNPALVQPKSVLHPEPASDKESLQRDLDGPEHLTQTKGFIATTSDSPNDSTIDKPTLTPQKGKVVSRSATDPVTPVTTQITISASVGSAGTNRVADVITIQQRLRDLNYLAATDFTAETPTPGTTGTILDTSLTATIAAIRAFQSSVLGMARPDGQVSRTGNTITHLNRAIARPSTADLTAITTARATVTETVTRGALISQRVGDATAAQITANTANLPVDVIIVQQRLVDLGYLNSTHTESPAAGATAAIPQNNLTATREAIRRFQTTEVNYWLRRGEITGTLTNRTAVPGDATQQLLNRISNYSMGMPGGSTITFRDFVRSGYTRDTGGVSVTGTSRPSALAASEYTAIGLTPDQTAALRYVSSHEGNFDALNTYDQARVSFGFIQFAGGRGLPPFMALLKSRQPTTFQTMFQQFGIDVEFSVRAGNIERAQITVINPSTGVILRGTSAEEAIRDDKRLSALFIQAGRNTDVQRVQVEAAARDYVLNSLAASVNFNADVIEVLDRPGGSVTATHAGQAARAFRSSPAFATLQAAGRINERTQSTSGQLQSLLSSQQGLAVLMDRAIQEGAGTGGGGVNRIAGAIRWVADQQGLTNIAGLTAHEQLVINQVVNDLTADITIANYIEQTRSSIRLLITQTNSATATIAGVLASSNMTTARNSLQSAINELPNKSFGTLRTNLESRLPIQQILLNFATPPTTMANLRTQLTNIRQNLQITGAGSLGINAVNARAFRARVQSIVSSSLTAP